MKIETTDQLGTTHGVKVLVYGRAGSGKTTLCATAPAPFIISAESGLLSLRHLRIPVTIVKDLNDLTKAYHWCMSEASRAYQTICLDSLSEIAHICLAAHKTKTKDGRRAYGEYTDEMRSIIRLFRDMPNKHVVMTCMQGQTRDEFNGTVTYAPELPGNTLTGEIPYYFDEVFQIDVGQNAEGQNQHYLRTHSDPQFTAKDRSGALHPAEHPDLNSIFGKIQQRTA